MRVLDIFGENKTLKRVRDLHQDMYDILVATAGAVVHMLNESQIFLNMFSSMVLDEAHHAVGGKHPYSKLLGMFHLAPSEFRPRLLGLTASPFSISTSNSAIDFFLAR